MKKLLLIVLSVGIGVLPFLPEPDPERVNNWTIFVGRFHLLLLHFPLVLILGLTTLELWRRTAPAP